MAVRPLLFWVVLCLLFNVSLLFAADQLPQALLTPPMGKDGAPMVMVPAGSFPMGVPQGDRDGGRDEYPRHDVFVDTFFIDKFEVTNGRYLQFVKATGHRVPQNPNNPTRNLWQGDTIADSVTDRPVINVDWFDAEAYCTWAGKRLPTEAEWEKAARGEDGRIFPWGNQMAGLSRANFGRTGLSGPVRDRPERLLLYPPIISVDKYDNSVSPYGLFQMSGNVAEWVADWYDPKYYATAPDKNPKGPEKGTQRSFRGGGWIDSTPSVRSAQRNGTNPNTKMNWMGFRCARDVKSSGAAQN